MTIVRNRTRAARAKAASPAKHRETRLRVDGETAANGAGAAAGLPMLRTSERYTFKRCRWKWWQEFEDLLKPRTDAPPLRFGSLIHKALADYYPVGVKRGRHPARRFAYHYDQELKFNEQFGFKAEVVAEDEVWVEARDLGVAMMNAYVDHYGKDDEWEVLVTEHPFQQLVYHPIDGTPWFWYVGTLDGIWRSRRSKKLSIVDHKTAKAISLGYLSLDIQASSYWTYGLDWIYEHGLLSPREKPAGMLYNHIRKAMPDPRPYEEVDGRRYYLNQDGQRSQRQPAPYFVRTPIYRDWNDREQQREQVIAEWQDMLAIRDEGERDGTSSPPSSAYKNQSQFTCPGCWVYDYCELHEMGANWQEMRSYITKPWEPYASHEIYSGDADH